MIKTGIRYLLGLLVTAAGLNHFWHTDFYVAMMPPYLPWHTTLVIISGMAEVGLGLLLLFRRWQALAGWGIMALCVAVFPANLHMALNPELFPQYSHLALWLRLPFQGVAIAWAWWYTQGQAGQRPGAGLP